MAIILIDIEWRKIPNFSRYEISEFGEVRITQGKRKGKILKGCINSVGGYIRYSLKRDDKKICKVFAHTLVATVYIGERPSLKHCVAHGDGNKLNNHYGNLRWATQKENIEDREIHGRTAIGSKSGRSILNEKQVKEIRESYTGKHGERVQIARNYGVSDSNVYAILNRISWKHI